MVKLRSKTAANHFSSKKRGFTLVELVIVIAVIAVLSAILIPTFSNVINNANKAKDEANAQSLTTQLLVMATMDGISSYSPQEVRSYLRQTATDSLNTKSKGTSIWYDTATGNVKALNTEEAILANVADTSIDSSQASAANLVAALGLSPYVTVSTPSLKTTTATEKTAEQSLYSLGSDSTLVYISGDSTLNEIIDTISNLSMYAKLNVDVGLVSENYLTEVGKKMADLYEEAIAKIDRLSISQNAKSKIQGALSNFNPNACIYFDNAGIYHSSNENTKFKNYLVTNGTTKISGSTQMINIDIGSLDKLVFPAGCTVNGNSLNNVTTGGGTKKLVVEVSKANSATQYTVKQFVQDFVDYATTSAANASTAPSVLNTAYDNLNLSDEVTADSVANLTSKIEDSVSEQISLPSSTNTNVSFVTGTVTNAMQYVTINIDYAYYQTEYRVQATSNNTEGTKTYYIDFYRPPTDTYDGSSASSTDGDYDIYNGQVGPNAVTALNNDSETLWSESGWSKTDYDGSLLSVYLIPTMQIETADIRNQAAAVGYITVNDDSNVNDVSWTAHGEGENAVGDYYIKLTYENYSNYGVIRGACVYHPKDGGTSVSFSIAPVMYIKRVSASVVTMNDLVEGMNNATIISVPDLSESVNMSDMTVLGVVNGEPVELDKLGIEAGANAGKYWYKADPDGITEVVIKDNNGNVVFRQPINR